MKKSLVLALFLFLGISLTGPGHAAIRDAGEYLKKNVVTKKLKNGITVLLLNRGYAPVCAFEIAFRVGSVDESYRTAGAAHLLEHMLFKGTDTIGTTDFAKERIIQSRIEAVGETIDRLKLESPKNTRIPELEKELARLQEEQSKFLAAEPYDRIYSEIGGVGLNASTSKDKTGYYIELPSSQMETWAKMESERLMNVVFREYYMERNNVLQERLMHYDSLGTGLIYERFMAEAFVAHPYRHPIIGWRSTIPFLSIEDIKAFYRERYIPSRMTITIVGMQDTEKTLALVEKYFGRIGQRPEPPPVTAMEPPQMGERRFILDFESNPYLVIGWHKPAFPSGDDLVCEVISELLTGGMSARLKRALVVEKKIASSISAWNGAPGSRYDNIFALFATPRPPHTPEELERAIYVEMDRLFTDVSEAELVKVVNAIESETIFGLETNKGLARTLTYYQSLYGDWTFAAGYPEMIRKVTVMDIKKAGARYFVPGNRTVGILRDSRAAGGVK